MDTSCNEGYSDCTWGKHSSLFRAGAIKHWNKGSERLLDCHPYPDMNSGGCDVTSRGHFGPNPFCDFTSLRRAALAPLAETAFCCYLCLSTVCWRRSLWRLPQVVVLLSSTHTSVGVTGFCSVEMFLGLFVFFFMLLVSLSLEIYPDGQKTERRSSWSWGTRHL